MNVELAIALPLGVVAHQLLRVESDLRAVSMKMPGRTDDAGRQMLTGACTARLDDINHAVDRIRDLLTSIEAELHPRAPRRTRNAQQED